MNDVLELINAFLPEESELDGNLELIKANMVQSLTNRKAQSLHVDIVTTIDTLLELPDDEWDELEK